MAPETSRLESTPPACGRAEPTDGRLVIPARAHFVWYGRALPWVFAQGIISAARRGGFGEVVLHHGDELDVTAARALLEGEATVRLDRLDADALFERCGLPAGRLSALYRDLRKPAAKANVVRAALLAAEGGVYIDIDTVTVRSLSPLREAGGVFCGAERLAFPAGARLDESLGGFAFGLLRTACRDVTRRLPEGFRLFRRVEHLYPVAPNNAVLGAPAGHPFVLSLLDRMLSVPADRRARRYVLGTKLLERAVKAYGGADLTVHAPDVFYPLGPEVSEHWVRPQRRLDLADMVSPATRIVHWYASVRTRRAVLEANAGWARERADSVPLCALLAAI